MLRDIIELVVLIGVIVVVSWWVWNNKRMVFTLVMAIILVFLVWNENGHTKQNEDITLLQIHEKQEKAFAKQAEEGAKLVDDGRALFNLIMDRYWPLPKGEVGDELSRKAFKMVEAGQKMMEEGQSMAKYHRDQANLRLIAIHDRTAGLKYLFLPDETGTIWAKSVAAKSK